MDQEAASGAAKRPVESKPFEYSAYGWKILGALWLVVLLVVAVPSVGATILNAEMVRALGMNRAVFGLGFGLFVLMMGLQGPVVAALMRRYGYRRTVTLGGLIMLAGSVAMATVVTSGWQYALAFGVLVGSGVCIAGMLPAQTVVTKWFVARRALAVSIVLSSIEIGGLLSPPGLERLLAFWGNDWRAGWWVIAALAVIAIFTARRVVDERHVEQLIAATPAPPGRGENAKVFKTTDLWSLKEAMRTRSYWLILTYMSIAGIGWVFLMAHGVVHLRDLGYSQADAAAAVAITVAGSFIGNMAAGLLGDRISPRLIAAAGTVLLGLGFFLIAAPRGFTSLLFYALPAGIGYGASQVCLMTLLGNYFGKDAFPTMLGSMMPVSTFCAATGAALAGLIYDTHGSYAPMSNALIGLCILASVAILSAVPAEKNKNSKRLTPSRPNKKSREEK